MLILSRDVNVIGDAPKLRAGFRMPPDAVRGLRHAEISCERAGKGTMSGCATPIEFGRILLRICTRSGTTDQS